MDLIACNVAGVDPSRIRSATESLARKLKQAEPDAFNMFNCTLYLVKRKAENLNGRLTSVNLIFRLPAKQTQPPNSLRTQLLSKSQNLQFINLKVAWIAFRCFQP